MATIQASATGGLWSATTAWTGGVVPGSGDDVQLISTSGGITIDGTSGSPSLCQSLNCTGYTGTLTHAFGKYLQIGSASGGSLTLVSGMTYSPSNGSYINFVSTTTGNTITTAGKTLGYLVFNGTGGGWQFQDALTVAGGSIVTLTKGSLDISLANASLYQLTDGGSTSTRSLTLGAHTYSLSSNWTLTSNAGLTFTCGTSAITASSANVTFYGGDQTYYNVSNGGTVGFTITGSNTYNNLSLTNLSGSPVSFTIPNNQTINGTLTVTGSSATSRVFFASSNYGTQITVAATSPTVAWADFRDINASTAWSIAGVTGGSGDYGGNTGITFSSPIPCYAKTGANHNFTDAIWYTTSGGSTAARVPLPQDTAVFDLNSITAGSVTITQNMARCPGINASGVTNSPTFNFSTPCGCTGNITFDSGSLIGSGTGGITLNNRSGQTFTTGGLTYKSAITINNLGATASISGALILSGAGFTQATGNTTFSSTLNCTALSVTAGTMTIGGNVTLSGALAVNGGTLTGTSYGVSGGTTCTGAGTINIGSYSGTTATLSSGSNWTFGTLTLSGAFSNSSSSGNMTIGSGGMTCTTFLWGGTGGTGTFTSGNGLINCSSTATWGGNGTNTVTLGAGGFQCTTLGMSAGASTPTYNLGSGTITLTGTGTVWNFTGGTLNCQTSTILVSDTSTTAKTLALSTRTYNNITVNGAASNGTVTISGTSTVNTWTFGANASILWTVSTTYTFSNLVCNGYASNLVTWASTSAGTAATHSCANQVSVGYMSIKDSTASGNVPFYAGGTSTLVSGNTNWVNTAPPAVSQLIPPVYSSNVLPAPLAAQFSTFALPIIRSPITQNNFYPIYNSSAPLFQAAPPSILGWNVPAITSVVTINSWYPTYNPSIRPGQLSAQYSLFSEVLTAPITINNWYPDYCPEVKPRPSASQYSSVNQLLPSPAAILKWWPSYNAEVRPNAPAAWYSQFSELLPKPISPTDWYPVYDAKVAAGPSAAQYTLAANKIPAVTVVFTPIKWYPSYDATIKPGRMAALYSAFTEIPLGMVTFPYVAPFNVRGGNNLFSIGGNATPFMPRGPVIQGGSGIGGNFSVKVNSNSFTK